jgi:hypothetical protein
LGILSEHLRNDMMQRNGVHVEGIVRSEK